MSSRARRSGALVRLGGLGVLVPPTCACCGEPSTATDLVRSPAGDRELIVGYCDACLRHVGTERTKTLAGVAASGLVGAAVGLSLPLARSPLPTALLALLSLLAALVPLLLVVVWPRTPARGHSATGPAVRFLPSGALGCANDRWALELARSNDASRELAPFRERRLSVVMLPALVVAPLLPLLVVNAVSPVVRVVNVTADPLSVELDGRQVLRLDPTSIESPSAGAELRVPTGRHQLLVRDAAGHVLEQGSVDIVAGHPHLFAPGSAGHCFWLETRAYGREDPGTVTREPLEGPPYFWSLPADLGGWFRPAPEAEKPEARLTGGVVTVLRQGPCETPL